MFNHINFSKVSRINYEGFVLSHDGSLVRACFPKALLKDVLVIDSPTTPILAKVISIYEHEIVLAPFENSDLISAGQRIRRVDEDNVLSLNQDKIGSILDARGLVIKAPASTSPSIKLKNVTAPFLGAPQNILERRPLVSKLKTGMPSIDSYLTLGLGQRMILLAEPGVGKSTLLVNLAAQANVDLVIFALIGERGREVTELYEDIKKTCAIDKTIIVASTSDQSAILRAEAANTAMRLAELAAEQGLNVLLAFDSLTRYLRALRDIALSKGEIPIRRGYPASIFEKIPQFIERAGQFQNSSITGIFTMLSSSEIDEDPFVEEIKGLTDGHIILSRALAERDHFPAIDIRKSISRIQRRFWKPGLLNNISEIKRIYCDEKDKEELLLISRNIEAHAQSQMKLKQINDFLTNNDPYESYEELESRISDLHKQLTQA